jgi:hypothetical protein
MKTLMNDEPVSVVDLANQVGKRKQSIFKILARLNIQTTKKRGPNSRGQLIAYITSQEAQLVIAELNSRTETDNTNIDLRSADISISDAELGVFYLLALEPLHDPGRFKVGFATSLSERLQKHRCSAPLLKVVKYWPCKRLWEKTAIDAVTYGCERIHTEVFRTTSINTIAERCEQFFALMPKVATDRGKVAINTAQQELDTVCAEP